MSATGESSTSKMMLPTSLAVVTLNHLYTFTVCSLSSFGSWNFFSNSLTISSIAFSLRDDSRVVSALVARSTSNVSDAALIAAGVVMLGASGQRTMITFGCRRVGSRQSRLCRTG
jgi:hypothetical protein